MLRIIIVALVFLALPSLAPAETAASNDFPAMCQIQRLQLSAEIVALQNEVATLRAQIAKSAVEEKKP